MRERNPHTIRKDESMAVVMLDQFDVETMMMRVGGLGVEAFEFEEEALEDPSESESGPKGFPELQKVAEKYASIKLFTHTHSSVMGRSLYGESEKRDTFRNEYNRFIGSCASSFRFQLGDEAFEIASYKFLDALDTYQVTKSTNFATYAWTVIQNALIDAVSRLKTERKDRVQIARWKALGVFETEPVFNEGSTHDDPTAEEALENLEPTVEVIPDPRPGNAVREALKSLSEDRKNALLAHYAGVKTRELAIQYGVSEDVIRQWRSRDKKRITKAVTNFSLSV